jgi:hypothetical protein
VSSQLLYGMLTALNSPSTSAQQYQNHRTPVANPQSRTNHNTVGIGDLELKRDAKRFKVQHDNNVYSDSSA